MKKVKEVEEKKLMEKVVMKLGVFSDGKIKEEIMKEVNKVRFE